MNATRLNTTKLPQDLQTARPVLSQSARDSVGLLPGLARTLLPFLSETARATVQRAAPWLRSKRVESTSGGERREPYLFGQRDSSAGAAD